jgi:hypothetical protein
VSFNVLSNLASGAAVVGTSAAGVYQALIRASFENVSA